MCSNCRTVQNEKVSDCNFVHFMHLFPIASTYVYKCEFMCVFLCACHFLEIPKSSFDSYLSVYSRIHIWRMWRMLNAFGTHRSFMQKSHLRLHIMTNRQYSFVFSKVRSNSISFLPARMFRGWITFRKTFANAYTFKHYLDLWIPSEYPLTFSDLLPGRRTLVNVNENAFVNVSYGTYTLGECTHSLMVFGQTDSL